MSNETPLPPPPTTPDAAPTAVTAAGAPSVPMSATTAAPPPPPASPYPPYTAFPIYPPGQASSTITMAPPPYPPYTPYPGAAPLPPGAPMNYAAYQAAAGGGPTTPWATTGLICALCGILAPIPCGVLGIIFGFVALSEIKASGDRVSGRGLAIAAIVAGAIVVVGYLALIVLYFVFIFAVFQSIGTGGLLPLVVAGR